MDSVARAAGISKPGLMYHFPSKEALLAALVDHVIDGYERDLQALVPDTIATASPKDRIVAYLQWAFTYVHDAADLVMLSDPKLRVPMTARWAERFQPLVEVPPDLPPAQRASLNAVRLLADGCWFAEASGVLPLSDTERHEVLSTALHLLEGDDT